MESIKLTEKQKEKLLEMCNALFKDSEHFTNFRFMPTLRIGFWKKYKFNTDFIQWIDQTNGKDFYIHWFEFCMTHLAKKIYNKLFNFSSENGYSTADVGEEHADEWFGKIFNWTHFFLNNPSRKEFHPIDYLYFVFKKLKL